MSHLAVIAFIIVFYCGQPVTALIRGMFIGKYPIFHIRAKCKNLLPHSGITFIHRSGIFIQIHKNETQELFQPDLGNTN